MAQTYTTLDTPAGFLPSMNHPFGIDLYSVFARGYTLLLGYHPDQFRFVEGVTPLSTLTVTLGTCVLYLTVIFGLREFMRNRAPITFPTLFKLHNLILSIGSAFLLGLLLEQQLGPLARNGLFWSVCSVDAWSQRLDMIYYVNYLFKYYELLDTVFMVFKKRPLEFLHYYHHSMTMLLCYIQLKGVAPASWVPISLNLAVHVVMYYYYYLASCGVRVWWKKYLTGMQIVQFVLDLALIYSCSYTHFAATRLPFLPNWGNCAGTESAAITGFIIISSYLFLFVKFYRDTYGKQRLSKDAIKQKKSQ